MQMEGLKDEQEKAKRAHLNIWRYGDAVDSDDDDTRFAQGTFMYHAYVPHTKANKNQYICVLQYTSLYVRMHVHICMRVRM
jgi:hypothetical protein